MATSLQPILWITCILCNLIVACPNLWILRKECWSRKTDKAKFITKQLQLWSLLCMISGAINPIITIGFYLPYSCYISPYLSAISVNIQTSSMGFFQLSRLYYCFSQNKVYSSHGYPTCLFIIMFIIGILQFIAASIIPALWIVPKTCGINDKYLFYSTSFDIVSSNQYASYLTVSHFVYFLWDVITLLLYTFKAYSFRTQSKSHNADNSGIWERIKSILYRVILLTIFYEFYNTFSLLAVIFTGIIGLNDTPIYMISWILWTPNIFVYNYAMYLMLQHNNDHYNKFLMFLNKSKLDYLCFCCCVRSMNRSQLELIKFTTEKQLAISIENQTYETGGISIDNVKIKQRPTNLSVESTK